LELLIKLLGSLIILENSCIEVLLHLVSILAMHDDTILGLAYFLGWLEGCLLNKVELTLSTGRNYVLRVQVTVLSCGDSHIYKHKY
jgi:hypothetical protein